MPAPEGAKHRDLEQRLRTLEQRVRELTGAALKRVRLAVDQGDFIVSGGGSVVVEDGGGVRVNAGGDVEVYDTGAVRVWGDTTVGTMEDGRFGVASHSGGVLGYPSTLAQPDGFLCDAGPGKGYAVFRVDEATGKAVVTSSVGQVLLPYGSTSDAANTRILLDGSIHMVTSSLRYKQDVEPAEVDPAEVLAIDGQTWRDKALVAEDPDTDARAVGFIAEHLDAHPTLRQFVDYDEQGRPNAIQYDRLSVALLALAKHQQTRLDDLTARVEAIEADADDDTPRGPRT